MTKKDALAKTSPAQPNAPTPVIEAEFVEGKQPSGGGFDFELAMRMFKERKAANEGKQIDNSSLYAGSPMFYYCRFCGAHTQTVPESYWGRIKTVCDPCDVLHKHGLI
jgi:hypothetical protein